MSNTENEKNIDLRKSPISPKQEVKASGWTFKITDGPSITRLNAAWLLGGEEINLEFTLVPVSGFTRENDNSNMLLYIPMKATNWVVTKLERDDATNNITVVGFCTAPLGKMRTSIRETANGEEVVTAYIPKIRVGYKASSYDVHARTGLMTFFRV